MDWTASLQGLIGGILIGLSATWLMATLGRIAGISGIIGTLVTQRPRGDSAWRLAFLLGLVSGPIALMLLGGGLGNVAGGGVDVTGQVIGAPAGGVPLMLAAGLLVGLGTGLGSGCTSGHGVCGLARLSRRSLVATLTFLAAAIVTVFVVRHVIGGGA
ncbi:YeeE/YedE family protein [Halomonas sp. CS7]|uniref:YeeE/YedE family protein n=1 Tax=Halomonas pelophila TaxID=3151122 RepID=A0ABV1N9C8_9GAMM